MCPHGYHHNGFMATPALGTQEVLFILFIYLVTISPDAPECNVVI